jgi:hypothetical protein
MRVPVTLLHLLMEAVIDRLSLFHVGSSQEAFLTVRNLRKIRCSQLLSTDTFMLEDPQGATISWTNDGIAWQSDISGLYGADPDTRGILSVEKVFSVN